MQNTNNEALARKALTYCIVLDMVHSAMTTIGTVNTADPAQVKMVAYDETVKAAEIHKA